MKQTAVEWYAEQGMKLEIQRLKGEVSTEKMLNLLFEKVRQAKAMEKAEKDKQYQRGFKDGSNHIKIIYNL